MPSPETDATHSDLVRLNEPLLNPKEAARLLNVQPSWVYDAVKKGRLPVLRLGRHLRFTRAMLEAWLQEQL